MKLDYIVKRFLIFLLTVWCAATLNFLLPRLSRTNPVRNRLLQQQAATGYSQIGIEEMIKEYERKFGLDQPLWKQYLIYLGDASRLDFGYSITNYPKTVMDMLLEGLPWTIGLMGTATLLAGFFGSLLGALAGWPRAPRLIKSILFPPLMAMSAVPFYIMGLVLLYVFAFKAKWFPITGGYRIGVIPDWGSLRLWLDVLQHGVLPAGAVLLTTIGFWGLPLRGMMVTLQGEDYMIFAEAKGLKGRTMFLHYALRNAILPQVTGLAISLPFIISGAILVEIVFGYPGLGTTLFHAVRGSDYFVIQGLVFGIICSLALATFLVDVLYPLLDPRITYRRA